MLEKNTRHVLFLPFLLFFKEQLRPRLQWAEPDEATSLGGAETVQATPERGVGGDC